ncbi:MAG: SRPBCC domain-containing protein [Myxococcaceae bacterium]
MAARAETTLKLVGDTELEITRVFRAKPDVVFDAWTKPELVAQWWAPAQRARCVEVTADVKPGGKYRYVLQALPGHGFAHSQGKPFAFIGTYLELSRPSRLVYTHTFEPMAHAGHCTVTVTFTAQGSSTLLVSREVYTSAQLRQTVLETGMEHGMREAMDQLDDLVARAG